MPAGTHPDAADATRPGGAGTTGGREDVGVRARSLPRPAARPEVRPVRSGSGAGPTHLLLGPATHGVTLYAAQLAEAAGVRVERRPDRLRADAAVHLHLTDRLLGSPSEAARRVEELARRVRLNVTLHDVPQPTDGPVFAERAAGYGRIVRAVRGWATNSQHERALVRRWCDPDADGVVIPLPVLHAGASADPGAPPAALPHPAPVVGVFGFVYPGKGHRQAVRAAAALRRAGMPVGIRAIGGPAPGHDDEVVDVCRMGEARGVPVEVTGRVPDGVVADHLRAVAVPVVAHRNVSASGSLNSWLAAGRRPLLRDGAYAREMAALRPGTVTLFDDATLADRVEAALRRPHTTWLGAGHDLRPGVRETVAAYRAWWETVA